jgi:hypothetical protein
MKLLWPSSGLATKARTTRANVRRPIELQPPGVAAAPPGTPAGGPGPFRYSLPRPAPDGPVTAGRIMIMLMMAVQCRRQPEAERGTGTVTGIALGGGGRRRRSGSCAHSGQLRLAPAATGQPAQPCLNVGVHAAQRRVSGFASG